MELLLLTADPAPGSVLPAVGLLPVTVRSAPPEVESLVNPEPPDLLLVDARHDLAGARKLCQLIAADGLAAAILVVVTEGGMVAVGPEWGASDIVLSSARPDEVHARLRLLTTRTTRSAIPRKIRLGDLTIDQDTYTVRLSGQAVELAYKEFELLKFLALHPGRVFTRQQLLTEVWGYDFYGGARTVDVHVRRLRAKLGTEHATMIATIRNVGYRAHSPNTASHDRSRGARA